MTGEEAKKSENILENAIMSWTKHRQHVYLKSINEPVYGTKTELTARINDEGWDTSFVDWLKVSKFNKQDVIFIMSVGGGSLKKSVSVNLIKAIQYAKQIKSKVIGIVGKKEGYTRKHSNVSVLIPMIDSKLITPHTEAFQAVVWHCLVSHPDLQKKKTKW